MFKYATGMWVRWQNTLAEVNGEIGHRAGRSHGKADGLSRRPNVQPERGRSSDSGKPEIKSTESEWNEMAEFSLATKAYWGEWQCLVMREGVIYQKWEFDGVQVHTQLLVPASRQKDILQQAHGERCTAHLEVKQIMARLCEKYFWHDMRTDVRS